MNFAGERRFEVNWVDKVKKNNIIINKPEDDND